MSETTALTAREFQEQDGLADWRVLGVGASAWFATSSHADGARLVTRVAGELPPGLPVPEIDVRRDGVRVRLPALPDGVGLTLADAAAARAVSATASDLGLVGDPRLLQDVQLTMDAVDAVEVMAFWQRVLDYVPAGEDDLLDAGRRDPGIWFQDQDAPRTLRNRIHLDVIRDDFGDESTRAELAAIGGGFGGPYGLALSDPEGLEVDLVPPADAWAGRAELADWRLLFSAMAHYPTTSLQQSAELVEAVAAVVDDAGLELQLDVRPGGVTLDSGKDRWEEDEAFEALAVRVQETARGLGAVADPAPLRFLQIGIAAADIAALQTFWRAALGYVDDPRRELGVTDVHDPRRLGPVLFFQDLEDDPGRRAQRNRLHVDVFVPDDQATARVAAAVAAGGRVVREVEAQGVTIADPEGNEVDIAVSVGREEAWAAAQAAQA